MKPISSIFGLMALAALLLANVPDEAYAQSSVRRVSRKTESDKKTGTEASAKTEASSAAQKASEARAAAAQKAAERRAAANKAAAPAASSDNATPVRKETTTTPVRRTSAQKTSEATISADGTLRSQEFDEYQKIENNDGSWQRVIYRELDVTDGPNASLYYPQEPMDGLTNMFRVILDLMTQGKVKGYEYLDGREVFSDKYEIKVKDMLDKFQVLYTEKPAVGKTPASFIIDESDVPCNEVLSYYIKERWEFDRKTSHFGPRILAICPVLHRAGDFGGEAVRYPMFWLNYEDLRPYLRKHLIVSEGMNNAPRYTMEDFFNLRQYDGEIYKVQNLRGLSLVQQYPNQDTLQIMRLKIENQLKDFEKGMFFSEAPTEVAEKKPEVKESSDASTAHSNAESSDRVNRRTKEGVDVKTAEAEKDAKVKADEAKAEKNGAAHSVRRRR